jgi:DNA polymerase III subunit delta
MSPDPITKLRQDIAAGTTAPLYMLVGDDEVEKSAVAMEFAALVDEGLQAFNFERVYGGETKADVLIETASLLPMMAPRRVIVVLEAEKLLVPKRETKAAESDQERLEAFLSDPPPQTTVVFVCGALDERRRVVKLLRKQATAVNCGVIDDPAGAERWVKARAERDTITLEPAAVKALVQRTGLDIGRLRAGFERVALYAMGQKAITAEDVRQAVPAAPDALEDFGIANAIRRNDPAAALHQLALTLDAGGVPFMVLGQLRVAAEKLPAARLRNAIDAVMRTDIALKSSGGDARVLLERLVVELCAGAGQASRGRW